MPILRLCDQARLLEGLLAPPLLGGAAPYSLARSIALCWVWVLLGLWFVGCGFCWVSGLLGLCFDGFGLCWVCALMGLGFVNVGFVVCWVCALLGLCFVRGGGALG